MSHYRYLEQNLSEFLEKTGIESSARGLISAHGDKCYGYKDFWEKNELPFPHGAAIYLISYFQPYSKECRETAGGWVDPKDWVLNNYKGGHNFSEKLNPL